MVSKEREKLHNKWYYVGLFIAYITVVIAVLAWLEIRENNTLLVSLGKAVTSDAAFSLLPLGVIIYKIAQIKTGLDNLNVNHRDHMDKYHKGN